MFNKKSDDPIAEAARLMAKRLFDSGKVLEAGRTISAISFVAADEPREVKQMAEDCFMAGAQHLWACLMGGLDEGLDATPADERRMGLIDKELRRWTADVKTRIRRGPNGQKAN